MYLRLRLCILISNPDLGPFNLDFVLAYEDRLTRALLSTIYQSGFDAARKLAAQRWFEERRAQEAAALQKLENEKGHDDDPAKLDKYIIRVAKICYDVLNKFLQANLDEALDILDRYVDLDLDDTPTDEQFEKAKDIFGIILYWEKFKLAYPGIQDKASKFVRTYRPTNRQRRPDRRSDGARGRRSIRHRARRRLGVVAEGGRNRCHGWAGVGTLMLGPPGLDSRPGVGDLCRSAARRKKLGIAWPGQRGKSGGQDLSATTSVAALPPPAEGTPGPSGAPEVFSLSELATASADFQRLLLHLEANRVYYANKIWAGNCPKCGLPNPQSREWIASSITSFWVSSAIRRHIR